MLPQCFEFPADLSRNKQKCRYGALVISNLKLGESLMRFEIDSDLTSDIPIPCHKIVYKSDKVKYSFLSYSPKAASKEYLEYFFTNLGYSTERLDSNMETSQTKKFYISFIVLKDLNYLEIEFTRPDLSHFFLENRLNALVLHEKGTFKYNIRKEISNGCVQVSEFINWVRSSVNEAEVKDKLVINCLIYGLKLRKKENFRVIGEYLYFIEPTSNLKYFRRILVEIQVKNDIIQTKFLLLGRVEQTFKDFGSALIEEFLYEANQETALSVEVYNNLKVYLKEINHSLCQGQFYWGKNLIYVTNYYLPSELNKNVFLGNCFNVDLELIKLHIPNLIQILFMSNTVLKSIIRSGKDLKIEEKFQSISFKLSPKEYSTALSIQKVLKDSRNPYLNNRFYYKNIKFDPDLLEVTYFTMSKFISFSEYSKEYPSLVIKALNNLISELYSLNLTFKDKIFPLELFNWYEERPVFSYSVPLSRILQIELQITKESSLESCKNSLLSAILQHHTLLLRNIPIYTSKELKKISQSINLIKVPQNIAEERMRLYEQNKISRCIQYYGLFQVKNEVFLMANSKFETTLNQKLLTLNMKNRIKILKKLFFILEEILQKNSDFCCFDLESFGQVQNKKLLLKFLAKEEINPIFKAPEVIKGRSCRSSLIFSFGKIVEYCLTENFTLDIPMQIKSKFPELYRLANECCEWRINKRINLAELKVKVENM